VCRCLIFHSVFFGLTCLSCFQASGWLHSSYHQLVRNVPPFTHPDADIEEGAHSYRPVTNTNINLISANTRGKPCIISQTNFLHIHSRLRSFYPRQTHRCLFHPTSPQVLIWTTIMLLFGISITLTSLFSVTLPPTFTLTQGFHSYCPTRTCLCSQCSCIIIIML
jgi:hypothetical protein